MTGVGVPEVPYLMTTADVAGLLRCAEFVRADLPPDRRHRQEQAMAGRWLRAHAVPFITAGKHKVFRREAVLEALAAAETAPRPVSP
jgi:hypothetical protein